MQVYIKGCNTNDIDKLKMQIALFKANLILENVKKIDIDSSTKARVYNRIIDKLEGMPKI